MALSSSGSVGILITNALYCRELYYIIYVVAVVAIVMYVYWYILFCVHFAVTAMMTIDMIGCVVLCVLSF